MELNKDNDLCGKWNYMIKEHLCTEFKWKIEKREEEKQNDK